MSARPAVSFPQPPPDRIPQTKSEIHVQTAGEFLQRDFPPKELLVENLLYRRDLVAFAGRRRHGKTTLIAGLVTALTIPLPNFLGYRIPEPRRVVVFFLEDDPREIQEKIRPLMNGRSDEGRLALYTREDFYREGIPVDLMANRFRELVEAICKKHAPDVIVFDNLAHLIGADYNNAKKVHELILFAWALASSCNAAVITAAHPRKRTGKDHDLFNPKVTLRNDPEGFFEEVMGSSHFVNSCGSLWGIERDVKTNRTDFLGGTQRFTGHQNLVVLEKEDDRCFRLIADWEENLRLATNTPARNVAWTLLPDGQFSYGEGEKAVQSALKSRSSFYDWFSHLQRLGLVKPDGDGYRKAAQSSA